MIDHLLKAPDEPTLIAAIGSYKNLHHVANPADGTLAGWRSDTGVAGSPRCRQVRALSAAMAARSM